jgi:hypothetical protein
LNPSRRWVFAYSGFTKGVAHLLDKTDHFGHGASDSLANSGRVEATPFVYN